MLADFIPVAEDSVEDKVAVTASRVEADVIETAGGRTELGLACGKRCGYLRRQGHPVCRRRICLRCRRVPPLTFAATNPDLVFLTGPLLIRRGETPKRANGIPVSKARGR